MTAKEENGASAAGLMAQGTDNEEALYTLSKFEDCIGSVENILWHGARQ